MRSLPTWLVLSLVAVFYPHTSISDDVSTAERLLYVERNLDKAWGDFPGIPSPHNHSLNVSRHVSIFTAWAVACDARAPRRVLYMMIHFCSTIPRIPNYEEQTVIEFGSDGVQ